MFRYPKIFPVHTEWVVQNIFVDSVKAPPPPQDHQRPPSCTETRPLSILYYQINKQLFDRPITVIGSTMVVCHLFWLQNLSWNEKLNCCTSIIHTLRCKRRYRQIASKGYHTGPRSVVTKLTVSRFWNQLLLMDANLFIAEGASLDTNGLRHVTDRTVPADLDSRLWPGRKSDVQSTEVTAVIAYFTIGTWFETSISMESLGLYRVYHNNYSPPNTP